MKKALFLSLALFVFACESEGPEPEVESEILEVQEQVSDEAVSVDGEQEIFLVVEKPAQFAGGHDAWNNFLKNQLTYPAQARQMGVEGRVFLTFVVQPDGELTDHQLVRGIGGGCDEEALRVIKESPYWNPGQQRGKKVATRMSLAITIKL